MAEAVAAGLDEEATLYGRGAEEYGQGAGNYGGAQDFGSPAGYGRSNDRGAGHYDRGTTDYRDRGRRGELRPQRERQRSGGRSGGRRREALTRLAARRRAPQCGAGRARGSRRPQARLADRSAGRCGEFEFQGLARAGAAGTAAADQPQALRVGGRGLRLGDLAGGDQPPQHVRFPGPAAA